MNKENYNYKILRKRIDRTIKQARGIVDDRYVDLVERGAGKLDEIIEMMKKQMAEGKFLHLFMNATGLQQSMHMLALAWGHLWSLALAVPKMKEIIGDRKGEDMAKFLCENNEAAYYSGKVLSGQYYIGSEFLKFFGKAESLMGGETAVIKASSAIFTGALME